VSERPARLATRSLAVPRAPTLPLPSSARAPLPCSTATRSLQEPQFPGLELGWDCVRSDGQRANGPRAGAPRRCAVRPANLAVKTGMGPPHSRYLLVLLLLVRHSWPPGAQHRQSHHQAPTAVLCRRPAPAHRDTQVGLPHSPGLPVRRFEAATMCVGARWGWEGANGWPGVPCTTVSYAVCLTGRLPPAEELARPCPGGC